MLIKSAGTVDLRLLTITLPEPLSLHYLVRRPVGSVEPQILFLLREIDQKLLRKANLSALDSSKSEQCRRSLVNQKVKDHLWATPDELKAMKYAGILSIRVPKAAIVTSQTVISILRHFEEDFNALIIESVIVTMVAEQRTMAQVLLHIKSAIYKANMKFKLSPDNKTSVKLLQNFFKKHIQPGAPKFPPPWQSSFSDHNAPILDLRGASLMIFLLRYPIVQATTSLWNSLITPLSSLAPVQNSKTIATQVDQQFNSINHKYVTAPEESLPVNGGNVGNIGNVANTNSAASLISPVGSSSVTTRIGALKSSHNGQPTPPNSTNPHSTAAKRSRPGQLQQDDSLDYNSDDYDGFSINTDTNTTNQITPFTRPILPTPATPPPPPPPLPPPPTTHVTLDTDDQHIITAPFLFPLFPTANLMKKNPEHSLPQKHPHSNTNSQLSTPNSTQPTSPNTYGSSPQDNVDDFDEIMGDDNIGSDGLMVVHTKYTKPALDEYSNPNGTKNGKKKPVKAGNNGVGGNSAENGTDGGKVGTGGNMEQNLQIVSRGDDLSDAIANLSLRSLVEHQNSHTNLFLAFSPQPVEPTFHAKKNQTGRIVEVVDSQDESQNNSQNNNSSGQSSSQNSGISMNDSTGLCDNGYNNVVGSGDGMDEKSKNNDKNYQSDDKDEKTPVYQQDSSHLPILFHVMYQHSSYSNNQHVKNQMQELLSKHTHPHLIPQIDHSDDNFGQNDPQNESNNNFQIEQDQNLGSNLLSHSTTHPSTHSHTTSTTMVNIDPHNPNNNSNLIPIEQSPFYGTFNHALIDPTTNTQKQMTQAVLLSATNGPSLNHFHNPSFSNNTLQSLQNMISGIPISVPRKAVHPNTHINLSSHALIPSPWPSPIPGAATVYPLMQFFFKPMSLSILPLLFLPRFQFRTRPSFFFNLYPENVLKYRPYKLHGFTETQVAKNGQVSIQTDGTRSQQGSSKTTPTTSTGAQSSPIDDNINNETDLTRRQLQESQETNRHDYYHAPHKHPFFQRHAGETDIEVFERILSLHRSVPGTDLSQQNTDTVTASKGKQKKGKKTAEEDEVATTTTAAAAATTATTSTPGDVQPHGHPGYTVAYKTSELIRASLLKAPARVPTYEELKHNKAPEVNLLVQAPYLIDCARCKRVMEERKLKIRANRIEYLKEIGANDDVDIMGDDDDDDDDNDNRDDDDDGGGNDNEYPYVCFCHFLPVKKSAELPANGGTAILAQKSQKDHGSGDGDKNNGINVATLPQDLLHRINKKSSNLFHFKAKQSDSTSTLPLLTTQLTNDEHYDDLSFLSLPGIVSFPLLFTLATLYQRHRHPYPYPVNENNSNDQQYQRYNSQLMVSSFQWLVSELKQPVIYNTTILELEQSVTAGFYPRGQQPDLYFTPDHVPVDDDDDDDENEWDMGDVKNNNQNEKNLAQNHTAPLQEKPSSSSPPQQQSSTSPTLSPKHIFPPHGTSYKPTREQRSSMLQNLQHNLLLGKNPPEIKKAFIPQFLTPLSAPQSQIYTNAPQPTLPPTSSNSVIGNGLFTSSALTTVSNNMNNSGNDKDGKDAGKGAKGKQGGKNKTANIILNTASINNHITIPGYDGIYTNESPLINLSNNSTFPYQLTMESLPLFRSFLYHLESLEDVHKMRIWRHAGLVYSVSDSSHCILELDEDDNITQPEQFVGYTSTQLTNLTTDLVRGRDPTQLSDNQLNELFGIVRSTSTNTSKIDGNESILGISLEEYIEQKIIASIIERESRRKASLVARGINPYGSGKSKGKGKERGKGKDGNLQAGRKKQKRGKGQFYEDDDDDDDEEIESESSDDENSSNLPTVTSVEQFQTLDAEQKKILYQKYVAKSQRPGRKPIEYHLLNNSYPEWAKKQLQSIKQAYHLQFQQLAVQTVANGLNDQAHGDGDSKNGPAPRRSRRHLANDDNDDGNGTRDIMSDALGNIMNNHQIQQKGNGDIGLGSNGVIGSGGDNFSNGVAQVGKKAVGKYVKKKEPPVGKGKLNGDDIVGKNNSIIQPNQNEFALFDQARNGNYHQDQLGELVAVAAKVMSSELSSRPSSSYESAPNSVFHSRTNSIDPGLMGSFGGLNFITPSSNLDQNDRNIQFVQPLPQTEPHYQTPSTQSQTHPNHTVLNKTSPYQQPQFYPQNVLNISMDDDTLLAKGLNISIRDGIFNTRIRTNVDKSQSGMVNNDTSTPSTSSSSSYHNQHISQQYQQYQQQQMSQTDVDFSFLPTLQATSSSSSSVSSSSSSSSSSAGHLAPPMQHAQQEHGSNQRFNPSGDHNVSSFFNFSMAPPVNGLFQIPTDTGDVFAQSSTSIIHNVDRYDDNDDGIRNTFFGSQSNTPRFVPLNTAHQYDELLPSFGNNPERNDNLSTFYENGTNRNDNITNFVPLHLAPASPTASPTYFSSTSNSSHQLHLSPTLMGMNGDGLNRVQPWNLGNIAQIGGNHSNTLNGSPILTFNQNGIFNNHNNNNNNNIDNSNQNIFGDKYF